MRLHLFHIPHPPCKLFLREKLLRNHTWLQHDVMLAQYWFPIVTESQGQWKWRWPASNLFLYHNPGTVTFIAQAPLTEESAEWLQRETELVDFAIEVKCLKKVSKAMEERQDCWKSWEREPEFVPVCGTWNVAVAPVPEGHRLPTYPCTWGLCACGRGEILVSDHCVVWCPQVLGKLLGFVEYTYKLFLY